MFEYRPRSLGVIRRRPSIEKPKVEEKLNLSLPKISAPLKSDLPGRVRRVSNTIENGHFPEDSQIWSFLNEKKKTEPDQKTINMNIQREYSGSRKIRAKLNNLLGPLNKPFERKRLDHSLDAGLRNLKLKLTKPPLRQLDVPSELEVLMKGRPQIAPVNTATKTDELIEMLKDKKSALQNNEPILDCFIRMKRAGHMNREPPMEVLNKGTYTRTSNDFPIHLVARNGYKRNRYGKPFIG